ncbi:hypothetical protein SAMN04489711_104135 [Paracidovorax wautersii]|uniref:Membrane protein involved in the export of O-antigen and teichoic acid n=1 Tax=Paracidovorax wautersii TaxID=1177982 RepID=A0A1I2CKC9_9BURK|nr:hypothetical protein SAMN04489711_104135 [Paracidovorax wautersii]
MIVSVAQLMYVLTSGWSNGAILNLGSRSFAQTGSYKKIVYYRLVIVALSFFLVSAFFGMARPTIEDYMKIGGLYSYMLILFVGYVLYDFAAQLLYPGNHDTLQASLELATTLTLVGIVAVLVHDLRSYVTTYAAASGIFASVACAIFLFFYHKEPFHWNNDDFLKVLNYSGWQIVGVLGIYLVNMGSNYLLVFAHVSFEQIGLYGFAYRIYSGFAPFFALFGILVPKWINASSAGIFTIEKKLIKIISILAVLYMTMGILLAAILPALGMDRYSASIKYFFLLFPAFLLTSYVNLMNTVMANTSRFRRAQIGVFLQCGLLMFLGFPLVLAFGVTGIIAAISFACAGGAIYFRLLYRQVIVAGQG